MKKTAIILLALTVGLCLAHGAFAEDYMVLVIGVNSGDIEAVYGADKVGPIDKKSEMNYKLKKAKYHTSNQKPDGHALPIYYPISETSHTTIYATSSPGCRYIWHPAGYYIKVCN